MGATLVEQLMKLDRGKLIEVPKKEVKARRLSSLAGAPVYVTVKAISGETYTDLISVSTNKSGKVDLRKARTAQDLIVVEGLVDPDPHDKALMEHFKADTPKELVELLFPGGDLLDVFNAIADLSGYGTSDSDEDAAEDEVKN